jgi:hypothetical protein
VPSKEHRRFWSSRAVHPMHLHFDRADYSVVVKSRADPPKPWRWEIYRAGTKGPIKSSLIYFETMTAARQAGKDALKQLLDKLFA